MRINTEQKNGNMQVEAKAAFIICKDVNGEPGSTGFVMGDTDGTDLLASTAVCAARLIQELSSGNPKLNNALTDSFLEAIRNMSSENASRMQKGGPPNHKEEPMVEVTVYAHPYTDQCGTLLVPENIASNPSAITEYINSKFWEIKFEEDDIDYGGTSYDVYVNDEELVSGVFVPDDDEYGDDDKDEEED